MQRNDLEVNKAPGEPDGKVDCSDKIFVGCNRNILQQSIRQKKMIKDHGEYLNSYIRTVKITADKKHMFVGDDHGNQKQVDVETQKVTHDYGKIGPYGIYSMTTTFNNRHLFVGNSRKLYHYQISGHQLVNDYEFGQTVSSVATTFDNKHVFVGLSNGCLQQICIHSQTVIKDYGKIHDREITSIAVARDNTFLITGSYDTHANKISIRHQMVLTEYDVGISHFINSMQVVLCDKGFFVYEDKCNLLLIDLDNGRMLENFGTLHDSNKKHWRTQMLLTRDGKHFFTSNCDGEFKQFSVRDMALVQDFGQIAEKTLSLGD